MGRNCHTDLRNYPTLKFWQNFSEIMRTFCTSYPWKCQAHSPWSQSQPLYICDFLIMVEGEKFRNNWVVNIYQLIISKIKYRWIILENKHLSLNCYGLNCVPSFKFVCWSPDLALPQNVTWFWDRALKEVIDFKKSH